MDSVAISLITCGPGPEIYSLYGHTALRIENQTTGEDIAVNWGIFNTRIPNFVLRFMFGLTDYQMALQPFSEMFAQYTYQQRWMLQQHLSLSPQEKLSRPLPKTTCRRIGSTATTISTTTAPPAPAT